MKGPGKVVFWMKITGRVGFRDEGPWNLSSLDEGTWLNSFVDEGPWNMSFLDKRTLNGRFLGEGIWNSLSYMKESAIVVF